MFGAIFELSLYVLFFTSLALDYSVVVIWTDYLLQAKFDPAALAVLQLALFTFSD